MGPGRRRRMDVHVSRQSSSTLSWQELGTIGAFEGLPPGALEDCAALALRQMLPRQRTIFRQGDEPVRFHALVSGWVRILQAGADGELAVVRFIGPAEVFGSFALFNTGGYPADAVTVVDSVELSWSELHMAHLIQKYPGIAINLVSIAARRLSELQERVREISTQPAEQRIANVLLRLAARGTLAAGDRAEIPVPFMRKDIASLAATTLYTASRTLAGWRRTGLVDFENQLATINSLKQLRRIADRT